MIAVIAHQMQITRSVRENIIDLEATMVNHTEPVWLRQVRSCAPKLAVAAVASTLQRVLKLERCKILSVLGLCKNHTAKMIESL